MTTENKSQVEEEYFNLIFDGLPWLARKVSSVVKGIGPCFKGAYSLTVGNRGIKGMINPAICGTVAGILIGGSYVSSQKISYENSLIAENGVVEKEIEGVLYTRLTQNNGKTTYFMRDGRVGKTLETMEDELRTKAGEVYDVKKSGIKEDYESGIDSVNTNYDTMVDSASKEARDAWGLSNPLEVVVKESETNFHENLNSLNASYDEVLGESKK